MILSFDTPPPDYVEPDETARMYADWLDAENADYITAQRRKSRGRLFLIGALVVVFDVGFIAGVVARDYVAGVM